MVRHDTFTISRHLDVPQGEVFTAFADAAIRRRWFRLPGSGASYEHDFRVGGGETARSTFTGLDMAPERLEYRSRYIDIAGTHRIVYGYEAVVDGELRLTYAQFFERCDRWSAVLQAMGVRKGDRVGTFAWNSHRHMEVYFAAPLMGMVLHTVNIRLSDQDSH